MWENETIVLITSMKKRILGDRDKIRFGKISADTAIPPFIKDMFKRRVENFIKNESPLSVQSTPHFDLNPDDLKTLRTRFLDVFREAASFHKKEVEEILREALVLRLDYLIKPMGTMRRLLFEQNDAVDFSTMENILKPFFKVMPYAEDLLKECRRLGKTSFKTEEYGTIATDLFHGLLEKDPVKIIMRDFSILTEYLSEAKGEEVTRIEGAMVEDFLADRNGWGFRRALEVEINLGKKDFNSVDLEVTLNRYLKLKEEFSRQGAEGEQSFGTKPETNEEIEIHQEESNFTQETKETSIDSWKMEEEPEIDEEKTWDIEEVLNDETFPAVETEEEETKFETKEKTKSKPMRIIRREKKEEEVAEEVEKEDSVLDTSRESDFARSGLKNYIDDKTENAFVKKLFGGDKESYNNLVNKLEEAESWRVAKILIDNELFKRDVDPFSREAIKLVDTVYTHYYPEEGVGGKK